jgi:hypothetical protein
MSEAGPALRCGEKRRSRAREDQFLARGAEKGPGGGVKASERSRVGGRGDLDAKDAPVAPAQD